MSQITINTVMLKYSVYYPKIYIYMQHTGTMSKLFMYWIQSDISNLKIENVELILNFHDAHQQKFKIVTINDTHK